MVWIEMRCFPFRLQIMEDSWYLCNGLVVWLMHL